MTLTVLLCRKLKYGGRYDMIIKNCLAYCKGDNRMRQLSLMILLTLLISVSAACGKRDLGLSEAVPTAMPSSQSQPQSASESQPAESGASAAKTADIAEKYADILRNGTYYIDCTVVIDMEGMQFENPMLIAVRGDNSSISVSSDLSGALVTMRTLVFDGDAYQINDAQRSYTQIDPGQSANSFDTDFSELRYIGESTGTFLGETRPCSEYVRGEQTIRFFFDGSTFVGLTQSITDEQVGEITMKINGLSANIPGKLVELPVGYARE